MFVGSRASSAKAVSHGRNAGADGFAAGGKALNLVEGPPEGAAADWVSALADKWIA
jgi:hypothetical protein